MSRIDWRQRVAIDAQIHHGDVCIKGTRIPVSTIVGSLADGMSHEAVIGAFPQLTHPDIEAALAYAAEVLKQETLLPLAT